MKTILAYPYKHTKEKREEYDIIGWEQDWPSDPSPIKLSALVVKSFHIMSRNEDGVLVMRKG